MEHREKCRNMTKNYGASKIKKHQQKGTSFLKISEGRIGMKSTGIVRKVDELGRVVLPIELRRTLDIHEKDPLEIFVDTDKIVLTKYNPGMACHVTGDVSDENQSFADGKLVLSKEGAEELVKEITDRFENA